MASLNLSHDELRAVEQTRQRLSQLSHSIGSLKTDVLQSNPLPNMDSLQASAKILENNMESLIKNMNQNSDVFSRVAVHPSTNFPGRTQEGILLQLLRKKPEPDVAAAMDQGRDRLASVVPDLADLPLQQQQYPTSGFRDEEDRYGYGDDVDADAKREREQERERERLRAAQIATIRDLESTWNASRQFFYDSAVRYAQEQAEGHLSDDDEDEDEDGVVMGGMSATDGDDVVIVDRPPPPPALDVTSPSIEGVTVENLLRFSTRAEFVA